MGQEGLLEQGAVADPCPSFCPSFPPHTILRQILDTLLQLGSPSGETQGPEAQSPSSARDQAHHEPKDVSYHGPSWSVP